MATVVGTDPRLVKRTTCRHCASIIEFTPSETRTERESDYGAGFDIVHILTCPKCGKEIRVNIY